MPPPTKVSTEITPGLLQKAKCTTKVSETASGLMCCLRDSMTKVTYLAHGDIPTAHTAVSMSNTVLVGPIPLLRASLLERSTGVFTYKTSQHNK